jgi:hypothetical protein
MIEYQDVAGIPKPPSGLAGKNPKTGNRATCDFQRDRAVAHFNTNKMKYLQLTTILCCGNELFYCFTYLIIRPGR